MEKKQEKFYITTAIDYVNGPPHIGHALEKIQADVLARYHRQKGDDVWFLTGTDEHGAKIARAAESAGKDPQEFVDEMSARFRAMKDILNLSWDDFIRTSDRERHWPGTQKIWNEMYKTREDIYKKKYRGLYCVGHESFITEKDLVNGKCQDHQQEPESIAEENYFFKLSKYTDSIRRSLGVARSHKDIPFLDDKNILKIFPHSRENEILSLINSGLEDVSFSRPAKDLSWGIPVPNDPEHTMYVWCDALSNYITAVGYGRDEQLFKKWWPADVHVIGKDILRFHAAIWPGMLLSAGLPLPRTIFVHGFITVDGQKMSKTVGNVIDPFELVKKYGTDPVRYYLLREIPSGEDGDFSYEKFEQRYNGDLANGLGNLVARVATLGEKVSPIAVPDKDYPEKEIRAEIDRVGELYEKSIREFRLNEALGHIWELISFADKYINDKKPWTIKDSHDQFGRVIANACGVVEAIRELILPFLPETAEKIKEQIIVSDSEITIKKGGNLFPRLG
jgi:methionyl-tRNA synthetase